MSSMDPEYPPGERHIHALDRIAEHLESIDASLAQVAQWDLSKVGDEPPLTSRPGSDSALREGVVQPPADAYEHHGLPLGHYWVWYEGAWITGNWDGEDWNLANGVTTSSRHLLRGPRISDPPAGGPPTPDLAAQPNSTTERSIEFKERDA